MDALARRLHDHAIDDALHDHLAAREVVAVMGGHTLQRCDAGYRSVAALGRELARAGWHVTTGGGPGAMEAANLGAWLCPYTDDAADTAISLLARAPDYRRGEPYRAAGQAVLDTFGEGGESLAVPTWFYGHEPTNQFASRIAKYFANSIREDGLLAIATRGRGVHTRFGRNHRRGLPGRHPEPLRGVRRGEPDGLPRPQVLHRDAARRPTAAPARRRPPLRGHDRRGRHRRRSPGLPAHSPAGDRHLTHALGNR